jgi:hypothetical protein
MRACRRRVLGIGSCEHRLGNRLRHGHQVLGCRPQSEEASGAAARPEMVAPLSGLAPGGRGTSVIGRGVRARGPVRLRGRGGQRPEWRDAASRQGAEPLCAIVSVRPPRRYPGSSPSSGCIPVVIISETLARLWESGSLGGCACGVAGRCAPRCGRQSFLECRSAGHRSPRHGDKGRGYGTSGAT